MDNDRMRIKPLFKPLSFVWNKIRAENLTMLWKEIKKFLSKYNGNISKLSWQLDFSPQYQIPNKVDTSGSPSS